MSQTLNYVLTKPQFAFVKSVATFPAFVGGFGSGKTQAAIFRVLKKKLDYPKENVAYYLPTYDLISQIAFPRFSELLDEMKIPHQLNKSEKIIYVMGGAQIILRTMDQPERIIGYEVADSVVDELDTLKRDKAAEVWRKIVARNRQKKPDKSPNSVGVATTPEGFRYVYENWYRTPFANSQLIRASTMSNQANLPEGYVQQLRDTYPSNMLAAYLDGEFVNLTQGSVYAEFDRELNRCNTTIETDETLHIGVDFNVGQMAACVHVLRDNEPHAVDEFVNYLDTPALIRAIEQRYPSRRIMVYPDASGKSRKSVNASESDNSLLRQAKFTVLAHSSNPFIKDRVAAFNKMIHKEGKRQYKINVDKCPHLTEGLEKQAYDKNGEPDKTSGLDHVLDAAGYFISYRYPVAKHISSQIKLKGL